MTTSHINELSDLSDDAKDLAERICTFIAQGNSIPPSLCTMLSERIGVGNAAVFWRLRRSRGRKDTASRIRGWVLFMLVALRR